jgi:hypothetical protein
MTLSASEFLRRYVNMFFHTGSCAFASLDSWPTDTVQKALL